MPRQVILLFGGESRERMVSVATAQHIVKALIKPICWFWDTDDQVYEVQISDLIAHKDPFHNSFIPNGLPKWSSLKASFDSIEAKESIFFVGFHGGMGEDGTVQKWLEQRGLVFTGSGSQACHLAFDKVIGKKVIEGFHVRVPPAIVIHGNDLKNAKEKLTTFFFEHKKIAVKPVADGSSVGLLIVDQATDLALVMEQIAKMPHVPYLIEAFISGTELTVGVIDEHTGPRPLPCTEIRTEAGHLFDYNGKYLGEGAKEITPAEVPDHIARTAQRVALVAHSAFGCEGYSRTDIIVDEKGPVFLELNTLPGLTQASLVPQQLAADGMTMRAFLELQIELALEKTPQKRPEAIAKSI